MDMNLAFWSESLSSMFIALALFSAVNLIQICFFYKLWLGKIKIAKHVSEWTIKVQ